MFIRQRFAVSMFSRRFFLSVLCGLVVPGVVRAQLTYSPTTLTFAPTPIGSTSTVQTLTVTNTSSSAVTPSAATVSANFAVATTPANTCSGNSIAAGGTCSISVDFVPAATGTLTGTISLTAGSTAYTAALSGVGMLPMPAATIFAASNVGGTAETATVTFSFPATATLSSVQVVTQGATGLDFTAGTQASSGSCKAATFTKSGTSTATTCTVVVSFVPKVPGQRLGSVTLYDNESTPLAIGTAYLAGLGNGPQALFTNGVVTTLSSSFSSPRGPSIDGLGNIFVANQGTGQVDYFVSGSGSPVVLQSNVVSAGTTVDGAGNFYYVNGNSVWEIPAGTFATTAAGTTNPVLIAPIPTGENVLLTDSAGNIFAPGAGNIYEIAAGTRAVTTIYTAGTVPSGGVATGNRLIGVALDAANNIYAADFVNNQIFEIAAGTYAATEMIAPDGNLNNPHGLEIDPAGDLYVTNYSNGLTFRYTKNSSGSYTATNLSLIAGTGIALAGNGNLVFTSGNSVLLDTRTTTAPLAFGSAVVGSTSSAQTVLFENDGNTSAGLTLPAPVASSGFTVSSNGCANPQPSGVVCTTGVEFTPQSAATYSGTLTYTDNTLNAAGSTQVVNLTGTAGYNLEFTTAPPASLQTGSNAGTVVVAVENSSNAVVTSQTPTVTLTVTGPSSYSQIYTATAVSGQATFNLSSVALTTTGTYSYAATVSSGNYYSPGPASETVYPYKLATTGVVTPQSASSTATNSVTVSVLDHSGNATTQTNAITLTVTGPSGPNSSVTTYGPFAASASTGAVTFTTAALTATGTYSYVATSNASPDGVAVTAAPTVSQVIVASAATTYTVTPASTTAVVGYADNITVSAYDTYGNLATNYTGTVVLTSTDIAATLPANFTLASGTATKPVTFNTLTTSGWTVTATDTVTASITGTSVAIVVQPVPSFVVTSSLGDTSGACTNQAATGATADSACTVYAAFAAVTALNNASVTSYVPTITFAPALTATGPLTITMLQPISATGNVSLIGPGAVTNSITLSGNNAVTFLAAGGTAVTNFTGLTFANFKGAVSTVLTANGTMTFTNDVFTGNNYTNSGNNGGVMGINGNITVTGCTFTNNFSAGGGGALASTPTALVINNSLFMGNTAANAGGAISIYGVGSVAITNTAFVSNKASSGYGGAVYFNASASLTVTNGTFNTNTATVFGGAIYSTGPYTIANSSFTGNSVSGTGNVEGGALNAINTGTTNSISSTNFIGNFATTTSPTALGGALYVQRLNLTNVLFSGNYLKSSTTSYGGAVYLLGAYFDTWTGVTLTGNCTVPPSAAMPPVPCAGTGATNQYGGAVFQSSAGSTNNLYNVTITGNSSKIGGGWERYNGTINLYNTVISGNATTGTMSPNVGGGVNGNNSSYVDTTNSGTTCGTAFCTPVLSALGSYGGGTVGATVNGTAYTTPVQTIVPLPGSPLLVAGSLSYVGSPGTLATGATVDARGVGYPRTTNGKVDIGAVQSNYSLSFVTQPGNTAVNAALLPPPTVQLYESGVPFTAGAGQTLSVAAQSGAMFTTAADSTAYSSVAITASGLESVAPYFSTPQADDALVVSVKNGAATPVTVASTTSEPFSITDSSAASIAFLTPPPAQLATGANAGIVKVALTSASGATNTSATAAVTLTVTGPSSYSQTYGPTAAVNGVVTFNLSSFALTTPGSYTYTASTSAYTTDTVVAPETVGGDSVWVLDASGVLIKLSTAGALVATVNTPGTAASYGGAAFDNAGDLWSVNSANNALGFVAVGSTGASSYTGGGLSTPVAVAVDGAGYVWVANSGNNTVSEFSDGRVAMSPAAGYGTAAGLSAPSAVALDSAGGVWVVNKTGNSVTHVFGAATPVVTPLASGTASGDDRGAAVGVGLGGRSCSTA